MSKLPTYDTPPMTTCKCCEEECYIIPLENDFDYAATHCTHGQTGTQYPEDYGRPVSHCCEAEVNVEEGEDQ